MFAYKAPDSETFPIQIDGQEDPNLPCYEMTQDMELKFTFHPASEEKRSSFTCPASDFIWKYELQLTTGTYLLNTLFESENGRQKIEPVPIPRPRASRNFPNVKTRNETFFIIGLQR